MAIANRPIDTSPTYTVGADVSRFQRSSVPGRAPVDRPQLAQATAPIANTAFAASAGRAAPSQPTGPVVRVARGNSVTIVSVGAK